MTLKEAERIVHDYSSVLARQSSTTGPAYPLSVLPHQPNRILQAMKLWLAHEIHRGSLSPEFRNEIGTAAANLASFTPDEEARHITGLSTTFSAQKGAGLSNEEFARRVTAMREVNEWTTRVMALGMSRRAELSAFIIEAQTYDITAPDYWDRIYILVGVERPVPEKTSFWKALWR
jgi:hypothetical protein